MFVAVYRWRVKPGMEAQFRDAWREGSAAIRDVYGSLGARLHLGEDGLFVACALWPDEQTWRAAHSDHLAQSFGPHTPRFREAILEDLTDPPLLKMHLVEEVAAR